MLFLLHLYANTSEIIGARELSSTLTPTALIVSTKGRGELCTLKNPCALPQALTKLKVGSTLYLRGGIYTLDKSLIIPLSGTKTAPIMIESYPHEVAILDGKQSKESIKKGEAIIRNGIHIQGKQYITIKNIEIHHMAARGINILYSSHIIIEGCKIHDNFLSGITIYGGNYDAPYKPYKYGYNTLKDNIIYNNSDAGLSLLQKDKDGYTYSYEEGDNADGISVSSGKYNRIIHNTVYANADDGIDLWRSNNSYVAYNMVYNNGRGRGGNGNGIKAGGNRAFDNKADSPNGKLAIIEHNIAFKNKRIGFDINSGKKVTYQYNTAWKNGAEGFTSYDDTIVKNNLAVGNAKRTIIRAKHKDNAWQTATPTTFITTDYHDRDFLKTTTPIDKGAYAKTLALSYHDDNDTVPIFLIGDSTVYNNSHGELGWGSRLAMYMKNPKMLFNQARSGASSASYKQTANNHHDWRTTKKLIKQACDKGGYLFIQFGHNNKDKNYQSFYQDLKTYILEARALGLTPVLITPVSRLWKYDASHKNYPHVVRDLAKDQQVLLLDLNKKSQEVFNRYPSHDAVAKEFGYDDHTHFNPKGATSVASWIKLLACESDKKLCSQFK